MEQFFSSPRLRIIIIPATLVTLCTLVSAQMLTARSASNANSSNSNKMIATIVGSNEQRVHSSFRFEAWLEIPKVSLASTKVFQSGSGDPLHVMIGNLTDREKAWRAYAQKKPDHVVGAKWINVSPDGNYLIAGFQDPSLDVRKNAIVMRTSDRKILKEVYLGWGWGLSDADWSSDSKFLVMLESKERWSKSLKGLLYILLSHPIPLKTFYLTIVDVRSGATSRHLLVEDIAYGEGILSGIE